MDPRKETWPLPPLEMVPYAVHVERLKAAWQPLVRKMARVWRTFIEQNDGSRMSRLGNPAMSVYSCTLAVLMGRTVDLAAKASKEKIAAQ